MVLVLAIAGLIFLIVFLALPGLQRSRRDTQRKSDFNNIVAGLENYASNRGGSYPPNITPLNFSTNFISLGDFLAGFTPTTDPSGLPYVIINNGSGFCTAGSHPSNNAYYINYVQGDTCDPSDNLVKNPTSNTGSGYAISMILENGVICHQS